MEDIDPFTLYKHDDDVIKWKYFPRYWPFVRGIHRFPVNFPHKGQWRRALMFSLICVWINGWVNNHAADDLRGYRAHYDVTVMLSVDDLATRGPPGKFSRNISASAQKAIWTGNAWGRNQESASVPNIDSNPILSDHFHLGSKIRYGETLSGCSKNR